MRELLLSGERWEGQAINYRKDGSEFVMEWSITPLKDADDSPKIYVAVQRNVTARIEAERRLAESRRAAQEADRKKSNLARYFSPRTAEILAERDQPLGQVRRQNVVVLIVDIVGFTAIGEALPPERVVALLRSFYRRMAAIIFAHNGSIERFAGDALMAIFGVPDIGDRDAADALDCAIEMIDELGRWNRKRQRAGRDNIRVCITAHHGIAVLGDIGTKASMSFTVIGDTVNTASRLQELCRRLDVTLLVSEELINRVKLEIGEARSMPHGFVSAGTHVLRGRSQPITVLTLESREAKRD